MTVITTEFAKPKQDWRVTMTPDDIYRNPMNIAWSFD